MITLDPAKNSLIASLRKEFGDKITRVQLIDYCQRNRIPYPNWLTNTEEFRIERGIYSLPEVGGKVEVAPEEVVPEQTEPTKTPDSISSVVSPINPMKNTNFMNGESIIPQLLEYYVSFGNHKDILAIVKSKKWFPTFVSGPSGCGKTQTILQVCGEQKRECFRVNITCETDEDDLLGGFRLVNGNTQFQYGPVIEAMKRGAILLLDEIDLASTKIMCLQPVLEGKSVYLKKVNEVITPKAGFNVIATANTKGQGNENGKYIGTGVLNEAFLDRFCATLDQTFPPATIETKILNKVMVINECPDDDFVKCLIQWADGTRQLQNEDTSCEVISTRRLVHIAEGYSIFQDRVKAIEMAIHRFNAEEAKAMLDLYTKIDASINPKDEVPVAEPVKEIEVSDETVPF